MTKVSIPRLRSIRFKDGRGDLTVIRQRPAWDAAYAKEQLNACIDTHVENAGAIRGFAMVVWGGTNNDSTATMHAKSTDMPSSLLPDFVRNRLLGKVIVEWARD